ncbi:MAG: valine--tRNA ligase [Bacteroidales bacterium]|nr:valine--tRNA ligase [Bacteroidales bacterium]MDZ4204010.1 valine--tRNA ligase [Bacteroidales bacterium]
MTYKHSDIPSRYEPNQTEQRWYDYWMEHGFFRSTPDKRTPYTIVIPPPNVTGVLHMGHMLNNAIQDILVRRARMKGFNALWLPGTDHASIATEAKVVNKLRAEGIQKSDITREEFLKHAWEWKEKHGGIILEQLKKLGASCDWDRTCFTMDEHMYESVIDVFIDLYNKGYIYRGVRMVNWDPSALTAVSDEEVNYKEVQSKLYYVRYQVQGATEDELKNGRGYITIATTRPETILGDTAVCVHPDDERFKHLIGKTVLVPLIHRPVPVISDVYVDREFGTGALKITPAHDINDYYIGQNHKLPIVDIFNPDGTLSDAAVIHIGEDRFVVREKIVEELRVAGNLVKLEDYVNKVGFSERTDAVIEPKLSIQWFCKMQEMARPALELVMNDTIRFHPAKFKNTYRHWMENVKDWCISRQLWWGQRIPAWYMPDGEIFVSKTAEEAAVLATAKLGIEVKPATLRQDEDVLDTWFSSWLWPISVFDGIRHPDNPDIQYYYPTNDLITAPEIMFFWVARMIMAGWEYRKAIPFKNVYYTGIVRDKLGRKMSKQLGNSPEPLELIRQYGADGVRVGMLLLSPAGNDLPFDVSLCEQGRNFSNKIWNALRLVKGWKTDSSISQPDYSKVSVRWFEARLNAAIEQIEDHFDKFRISDALMTIYKLIWDDFCSWYLEMIKPPYGQPIDNKTLQFTLVFFDKLMHLLHPFMPFITEEIWHLLKSRQAGESIMIEPLPEPGRTEGEIISQFDFAAEVINAVRNLRAVNNIAMRQALTLLIRKNNDEPADLTFDPVVIKLCNLDRLKYTTEKISGALGFVVKRTEFFVPIENTADIGEQIARLQQELDYTLGFLVVVQKKLSNEKFIANAKPEVVEIERRKESDALARIKVLEEQIASFKIDN